MDLSKNGKERTKETEAVDCMIRSFEDNQEIDAKSKILMRKTCRELYIPVTYRSGRRYAGNCISYLNVMYHEIRQPLNDIPILLVDGSHFADANLPGYDFYEKVEAIVFFIHYGYRIGDIPYSVFYGERLPTVISWVLNFKTTPNICAADGKEDIKNIEDFYKNIKTKIGKRCSHYPRERCFSPTVHIERIERNVTDSEEQQAQSFISRMNGQDFVFENFST